MLEGNNLEIADVKSKVLLSDIHAAYLDLLNTVSHEIHQLEVRHCQV